MYDVDRSGETDRIRMRGSGRMVSSKFSACLELAVAWAGAVILLTSAGCQEKRLSGSQQRFLQQRAFVSAPTKAVGAAKELMPAVVTMAGLAPSSCGFPSSSISSMIRVTIIESTSLKGGYELGSIDCSDLTGSVEE
jgi:hypothetical protein